MQQFPDRLPWMVSGHVRQTRPAGIREILKPDSTGRLVRLLNLVLSKVLNLVSIDLAGFSKSWIPRGTVYLVERKSRMLQLLAFDE